MIGSILGSAVPTFIAIIGGAFYLGDKLGSLKSEVEANSKKIDELQACMDPNGGEEE